MAMYQVDQRCLFLRVFVTKLTWCCRHKTDTICKHGSSDCLLVVFVENIGKVISSGKRQNLEQSAILLLARKTCLGKKPYLSNAGKIEIGNDYILLQVCICFMGLYHHIMSSLAY